MNPTTISPFIQSYIRTPKRVRIIDVIDRDKTLEYGAKIFVLMNLTWQYADTILDLVRQMKEDNTKPLSRKMVELKREYDKYRAQALDTEHLRREDEIAEVFEEQSAAILSDLFHGISKRISRFGLDRDRQYLIVAAHQALTLTDAVDRYSAICEEEIWRDYMIRADRGCFMQKNFAKLPEVLRRYAGRYYIADIEVMETAAEALALRMKQSVIRLIEDADGKA